MAKKEKPEVPSERFTPPTPEESGETEMPPLVINGQYIKDLSFEAPKTPGILSKLQQTPPEISVNIDVQANSQGENFYEVNLSVNADAKIGEDIVYLCEVQYCGLFTLNVQQEYLEPALLIDCPTILFPYLRRVVSDLTGDAGFAPLLLNPLDFAGLYKQRHTQTNEPENGDSKLDEN